MFQHVTQVLFAEQHVDPMAAIRLYKTKLLYDQFHAWIVPSLYQDTEVRMSMSDGADLVFSKTGLVSVLLQHSECSVNLTSMFNCLMVQLVSRQRRICTHMDFMAHTTC